MATVALAPGHVGSSETLNPSSVPAGWLFMTYNEAKHRSAMTAIAAALALSSTPLFAQDTGVTDPVPETVSEPVTATPDPLAPEPTAPEAATVTETATPPAKASKPAAKAKVAARQSTTTTPTTRTSATRPSAATRAAPVTATAPATPPATEAIEVPVGPPVAAAPEPAPDPAESASLDQAQQMDTMLEVGGAGLLAMLLGGMALRSRRRRKEEERIEEAKWAYIETHPEPEEVEAVREPAFARSPAPSHDPVPATSAASARAPVTKLPKGFDLSRFGPHVQAAYRGPTPDNPSLSLRYRLRRASAFDQQERRAANAAVTRPAASAPARSTWAARDEAKFMLRRANASNTAKPAFQR